MLNVTRGAVLGVSSHSVHCQREAVHADECLASSTARNTKELRVPLYPCLVVRTVRVNLQAPGPRIPLLFNGPAHDDPTLLRPFEANELYIAVKTRHYRPTSPI